MGAALRDTSPESPTEAFHCSQQNLHCSNGSLNSSSLLDDLRQSELHLKRKKVGRPCCSPLHGALWWRHNAAVE